MAFNQPQLPLPIPPQLQLVEQTWGPSEQQGIVPPGADGCSFYRSLARQLDGNPDHYWKIRDAVLDHYVRVFIDQGRQGGLYSRYIAFDNNFPSHRYGPFFFALSAPDPAVARPPRELDGDVLLVICNALNIRIVIWDDNYTILRQRGAMAYPEYHMKQVPDMEGKEGFRFDSLLHDESGATLVDNLLRVKHDRQPLDIREITWWHDPHPEDWTDNRILDALGEKDTRTRIPNPPQQHREYKCYNEHLPVVERWQKPDLRKMIDSFTVFTVSVAEPRNIRAALDLMDYALQSAPAQELPVSCQDAGNFRPLKRYVGIDAEFSPVRLTDADFQIESAGKDETTTRQTIAGREEGLCTVLTIAVDRHLVFSFYLLHMLQNADERTVREISLLFERVIFNQQLLKLWFNYQSDIVVLDATIAHMYQGTPRVDHMSKLPGGWGGPAELITPTFKVYSQYFHNQRPNHLQFPQGQLGCELHRPGSSHTGLKCPCAETGNIDITTILDFICRQLGYTRGSDVAGDEDIATFPIANMARSWTTVGYRYNYGKFTDSLMGTERLHELLSFFKEVPKLVAQRFNAAMQSNWYTLLKPGMEREQDMMGYNIGDVVGIALLMRLLTTTDDRLFLASKLLNHDHVADSEPYMTQPPHLPAHLGTIPPPPGSNLALINDYPKMYHREPIGHYPVPDAIENANQYARAQRFGTLFRGPRNFWTRPLPFLKHEPRIHRRIMGRNPQLAQSTFASMNQALGFGTQGDQAAYEFLFDPTDFTFPEWFTTALNQPVRTNEVPAGVPHVEDLRDKIIAESQRRGGPVPPPRGFRGLGFMRLLDEFFDRNFAPVGQEQWGQRTPPLWPGWAMGMNTGRVDRVMRGGVGPRGGRRPSGGRGGRGF